MSRALIGHTGFIGGNLLRQSPFDALFNSKNIKSIRGQSFDLIVCAGAPGEKWKADQNPEADQEAIEFLKECLADVSARRFILISTADIYGNPWKVDEDANVDWQKASPYGRHRWELEKFVAERFDRCIVRLPTLFGPGLKRNVVFDLIHRNQTQRIHADGQFQFYSLAHLWEDLQKALTHSIPLLNMATEPVTLSEAAQESFGMSFENRPPIVPPHYEMRSVWAEAWGGADGYLYRKPDILRDLRTFVTAERARR